MRSGLIVGWVLLPSFLWAQSVIPGGPMAQKDGVAEDCSVAQEETS